VLVQEDHVALRRQCFIHKIQYASSAIVVAVLLRELDAASGQQFSLAAARQKRQMAELIWIAADHDPSRSLKDRQTARDITLRSFVDYRQIEQILL